MPIAGDRSAVGSERTLSNSDQTSSGVDQDASERDQLASDRDQHAADLDQAASDRTTRGRERDSTLYARTRRTRAQTTLERDRHSQIRSDATNVREATAKRRDLDADARDAAAEARDRIATARDAVAVRMEGPQPHEGKPAAASRAFAALQREEAARDRARGREDRVRAAADRHAAADELVIEGVDHLTGTLRRRAGALAIQREIDRTRRTHEPLVICFVDVEGLKAVNDEKGHEAGDDLLFGVACCIKLALRPYDVIVRFGGDEFVCSLSGQDLARARRRFEEIAADVAETQSGAKIAVGFAQRGSEESLDQLVARADAAMIAERSERRAVSPTQQQ